jgi:hypothetical protein
MSWRISPPKQVLNHEFVRTWSYPCFPVIAILSNRTVMLHSSLLRLNVIAFIPTKTELREWRSRVLEQSESNRILQRELKMLDQKIGLLVAHKLTAAEVMLIFVTFFFLR